MSETNQQSGRKKPRGGTRARRGGRAEREPKLKLYNVVQIRFYPAVLRHDYDAHELMVRPGERVVVETVRGPTLGEVVDHVHRKSLPAADALPRVLRLATEADLEQEVRNAQIEREAQVFALDRIRARRLPLKLIRAQLMHDGSKIVFYFSAEGRIDFRELVKDLAHRFRTRIEMHQIGVRDGAKMLGGIGPCGRELCCSTFLENFAPVSIRMAKDQGLTLNPKKVSGMCGRLMCCLVYEQQIYKRMRKLLPRPGQEVETPQGPGSVASLDVINKLVTVRLEDGGHQTFPATELAIRGAALPYQVDEPDEADDSPLWDDVILDESPDEPVREVAPRPEPRREEPARRPPREEPRRTEQPKASDGAEQAPRPRGERGGRGRGKPAEAAPAADAAPQPTGGERGRRGGRRGGRDREEPQQSAPNTAPNAAPSPAPAPPEVEEREGEGAAGEDEQSKRRRRRRRRGPRGDEPSGG